MLLGHEENHMDRTYCMLNIREKLIVLICDVIQINKAYGEYVSRITDRLVVISYRMKTSPMNRLTLN